MFGLGATTHFDRGKCQRKAAEGTYRSLQHAAAAIRQIAYRLIRPRKRPSAPGRPPHTQRKSLPRAILYALNRLRSYAIIGPAFSRIKKVGAAHEGGGAFRGRRYPSRPYMGPALIRAAPRLPGFWRASVRE